MYSQAKAKGKAAGIVRYKEFNTSVVLNLFIRELRCPIPGGDIWGGNPGKENGLFTYPATLIFNCQELNLCFCFQLDKTYCANRQLQFPDIGHSQNQTQQMYRSKPKYKETLFLLVFSQNNPTADFSGAMPWIWKTSKPKWMCPQGRGSSLNFTTMKWFEGNWAPTSTLSLWSQDAWQSTWR